MCHSRIPTPLAQALPKGDTCPLEPVEAWRPARGLTGSSSSTPPPSLSLLPPSPPNSPAATSKHLPFWRHQARPSGIWPDPGHFQRYESVFWGWGGGWTQGSTQRRAAWGPPTNHCCILTVRPLDTGQCGHLRQHRDCAPDVSTSAVTSKVIQAKAAPVAHGSGALRTPDMVCLHVGALDAEKGLDPPTHTHTPDLLWEGCQHF